MEEYEKQISGKTMQEILYEEADDGMKEEFEKISFLTDIVVEMNRYFINNEIDKIAFANEHNIDIDLLERILHGNKDYTIKELFIVVKKMGGKLSFDLGLGDKKWR